MRSQSSSLLVALSLLCISGCKKEPEPVYQELYEQVVADPFDMTLLAKATRAAARAESRRSQDRWAYILGSYANLRSAYTHGDSFRRKSYEGASFEEAKRLALKVREMCPDRVDCLVPSIRIQIIEDSLETAKSLLNQAYGLDTANFHVWYYRAEIEARLKAYDLALTHLDDAQRLARTDRHRRWVVDSKIDIAERRKDHALAEQLHRELIAMDPQDAYSYGNFGNFLLKHDRPAEAVVQLEKAVSLRPYPMAKRKLEEAKAKAGSQ